MDARWGGWSSTRKNHGRYARGTREEEKVMHAKEPASLQLPDDRRMEWFVFIVHQLRVQDEAHWETFPTFGLGEPFWTYFRPGQHLASTFLLPREPGQDWREKTLRYIERFEIGGQRYLQTKPPTAVLQCTPRTPRPWEAFGRKLMLRTPRPNAPLMLQSWWTLLMDYRPGAFTGACGQANPRVSNVMKGYNTCWQTFCWPMHFKGGNRKWVRFATCNSTSPAGNGLWLWWTNLMNLLTPHQKHQRAHWNPQRRARTQPPPPVSAEAKDVDNMAKEIQEQLEANKEKNRPPQASKPANQKDKASKALHKKKAAGTHGAEISSKSKAFPGTGAAAPKKKWEGYHLHLPQIEFVEGEENRGQEGPSLFLEEGGTKTRLGQSHRLHGYAVKALHEARPWKCCWGNNGKSAWGEKMVSHSVRRYGHVFLVCWSYFSVCWSFVCNLNLASWWWKSNISGPQTVVIHLVFLHCVCIVYWKSKMTMLKGQTFHVFPIG